MERRPTEASLEPGKSHKNLNFANFTIKPCHSHGLSPFSSPTSGCRKFKEYAIIRASPLKRGSGLLYDTVAQNIHHMEALQHHTGRAERSSTLPEYLASIKGKRTIKKTTTKASPLQICHQKGSRPEQQRHKLRLHQG